MSSFNSAALDAYHNLFNHLDHIRHLQTIYGPDTDPFVRTRDQRKIYAAVLSTNNYSLTRVKIVLKEIYNHYRGAD